MLNGLRVFVSDVNPAEPLLDEDALVCDFDCGFEGSFDAVAAHEQSCRRRSDTARALTDAARALKCQLDRPIAEEPEPFRYPDEGLNRMMYEMVPDLCPHLAYVVDLDIDWSSTLYTVNGSEASARVLFGESESSKDRESRQNI